ncbi:Serine/threonine-protein kinase AFC3 [Platanthera guangdongensis]|uniref:Serine/threonine-protein kinase AFC3 n=1 Tax=Platanthera guangdongensis TaxID=2320717 RepID=A0ABR2LTH0_9ASPA
MDDLDRGAEDRVLESLSSENLKFSMDETSSFSFTDFVPEFMQKKDLTTVHFLENNNSEVLGNGYNDEKLLCWKTSELEANDESECGIVDGDIKESESLSADGENDDIPDDHQLFTAHEVELETFDLRIIHRKNRTGFEENKDLQIVLNSIVAGRYYLTECLGSAAFSKVVQARDLYTGTDVCLKIIKNDKDFFDQSLDEIKLLKYVNKNDPSDQCHLLRLYEYFYHKEHLFIVCELLRANLYEFQKFNQDLGGDVYFTLQRIQAIARQCLEALQYLHGLKVIHCDLKPENILIKSYSRCEIKIIDLGSSCFLTDNLRLYVQSRSYRAPEVILGVPYDEKIDIWSLGCILAELYTGEVLFLNDSLAMILARMIGILGPIDVAMLENGQEAHKYFTEDYDLYLKNEETDTVEYLIPEKSSLAYSLQVNDAAFLDFLGHLLQVNPERRLTASQALRHGWFSVSYNCGSCGYSLNLSSSCRNTNNIGSKYRKIIRKGIVSFYSIDESRFSQTDEMSCLPYFNSMRSWGFFRHRTKLRCRKCGGYIGSAYEENSRSPPPIGSDNSDSSPGAGCSKKYKIKISALQPSESGSSFITQ